MLGLRGLLRGALRRAGYDVIPFNVDLDFNDFDLRNEDQELGILSRVGPFTMTSRSRISALCRCVEYVVAHDIPGDIVECGVWRGGSMMAVALRLQQLGTDHQSLYLYDTFEGMTPPSPADADHRGRSASAIWQLQAPQQPWLKVTLDEVRRNLESTGYPVDKLNFIPGPVEQTLAPPGGFASADLDPPVGHGLV